MYKERKWAQTQGPSGSRAPHCHTLACRRRSSVQGSCLCSECSLFPQHVVCAASTSFSVRISWRVIAGKSWFAYRDHTEPRISLQRRFLQVSAVRSPCFWLIFDTLLTPDSRLCVCAVRLRVLLWLCTSLSHSVCVFNVGSSVSNQSKRLSRCVQFTGATLQETNIVIRAIKNHK